MPNERQNITTDSSADIGGIPGDLTSKDQKIIKHVMKLFGQAKEHRKKYDHRWLDYYKFFRGKQWTNERPSYKHSEVINFVFQSIQSTVPIQTDARPKFEFLPQEPADRDFAKVLNELAQSDWDKHNWNYKLT